MNISWLVDYQYIRDRFTSNSIFIICPLSLSVFRIVEFSLAFFSSPIGSFSCYLRLSIELLVGGQWWLSSFFSLRLSRSFDQYVSIRIRWCRNRNQICTHMTVLFELWWSMLNNWTVWCRPNEKELTYYIRAISQRFNWRRKYSWVSNTLSSALIRWKK